MPYTFADAEPAENQERLSGVEIEVQHQPSARVGQNAELVALRGNRDGRVKAVSHLPVLLLPEEGDCGRRTLERHNDLAAAGHLQ